MGSVAALNTPWWKDSTIYQIYPASFKDANGDGLGDLPGILSKIDYLASLGVDAIWVCPMYASPQVDMGYDISDYEAVHGPYGTVADMEALIAASHERGMRVLLDLVVNHTSDQHAWFRESRSSKDSPKRDWYIWRPARRDPDGNRLPPTNWRSYFGGSAWEWDEATGEYYLHLFAREQPDLNWENEDVRQAIYKSAMRFWLDRGVGGFRVDTVNMYSKGTDLVDAPVTDPSSYYQPADALFCNGPRMHEFLREMNAQVLDHYGNGNGDVMTVGELPHTPDEAHVRRYISAADRQLSMVFQFDVVDLGQGRPHKYAKQHWKLPELKRVVSKWQRFIEDSDAWTTAFCENHDQGRSVSRYGSDDPEWWASSAKALALMMTSLTGTLFVYQGQEIGTTNVSRDWPISDYQDIESLNYYNSLVRDGASDADLAYAMDSINLYGRDNARLPMQWDDAPYGGFTDSEDGAWMRVHNRYRDINVAKQDRDPSSVLNFWRALLRLRKDHADLLVHGSFETLDEDNEDTFTFVKRNGSRAAVVVVNFTTKDLQVDLPQTEGPLRFRVGNYEDAPLSEKTAAHEGGTGTSTSSKRSFRPWEARLYLNDA